MHHLSAIDYIFNTLSYFLYWIELYNRSILIISFFIRITCIF